MTESISQKSNDVAKWLWYDVMKDLREQGGITDVIIEPMTVSENGCGGVYQRMRFYMTWVHNRFLLVTMLGYSQPLVDAFAKVVGYQPFCMYVEEAQLITVEWDKIDPVGRLAKLKEEGRINLKSLPLPE